MSSEIKPNKSSSRSGRFKKKLIDESTLALEAPVIENMMLPYYQLYLKGELNDVSFTAIYIVLVLSHRYPKTWAGAKRSEVISAHQLNFPLDKLRDFFTQNIQTRLEDVLTLGDLFAQFSFKSTPLSVQRSILQWSLGRYGLELMDSIPSPRQVLNQQIYGRRVVSVFIKAGRTKKYILGERDALGFTMHDLIHADHFYHSNSSYQGQLGFYGFLHMLLNEELLKDLENDQNFQSEFEYLIADMNAYPIHLLKCFKAALVHYHPQKEDFFERLIEKLEISDEERYALRRINNDDNHEEIHQTLLGMMDRYNLLIKENHNAD